MLPIKSYGYLSFLAVAALLPTAALLVDLGVNPNFAAWFPLGFLFVLLPLLDYALGRDQDNPENDQKTQQLENAVSYRWLTVACLPIYVLLLIWSCATFVDLPFSLAGQAGWLLSQGVIGGILAINVAHELIHKPDRWEPLAGGLLLASVVYAGFKVEHLRGHHVHVSTPRDASSARFGQSLFAFLPSALWRNAVNAWRLEAKRLKARGLPALHWRNELIGWYAVSGLFLAGFTLWAGSVGALFFLAQAAMAGVSLEIINYVEHYGLERRRLADGRYERVTHQHSWNSSYRLSNWMLFQLQRHSDHHAHPRRRYQALRHYDDSPQLPGGYSAMFVLALIPPLWRRVMDPRVQRYYGDRMAGATEEGL